MPLDTPVVLAIFRRPDLTRRVMEQIGAADPATLFVIADAPRDSVDTAACEEAREVVRDAALRGQVQWNISEKNLGSRTRIVTGLDWVFGQVERAIILEDDCIPSSSFFPFCESLLERYRDDDRVMEIGGCNFLPPTMEHAASYYFSKYVHTWGWATWARAWRHFDENISTWPEARKKNLFKEVFVDSAEEDYWTSTFDRVYCGDIATSWDFQWLYGMWCQHALSIVPAVNLVMNAGFGADATHHRDTAHPLASLPAGEIGELRHPDAVLPYPEADEYEFIHAYGGASWRSPSGRLRRAFRKLLDGRAFPSISLRRE